MKILDQTFPTPAENLACDEALLDAAEAGASGEVLRFWESQNHFVVVGYANKVAREVNVAACERRQIPILRRCSGGGTVVQGPGCLSYAVVLRITEEGPTRSISAANQFIMERNRAALEILVGQPVAISGHTDLAINGRKFSGNAQRRRRDFLLFHGTLLLNFDLPLVSDLLPMPSLQPDYRNARRHEEFLVNLGVSATAAKAALAEAWQAEIAPLLFPATSVETLARSRYETSEWNLKF